MIIFIAHLHVPRQNASAFEELMTYVTAMTNEHESGVAYYGFAKSVDEADTYVVVEVYRDRAACASHGDTDWVRESVPKSMRLIEGMPNIMQYVSPGTEPVVSRLEELS
jgi:quinol monooxygenase YgiN